MLRLLMAMLISGVLAYASGATNNVPPPPSATPQPPKYAPPPHAQDSAPSPIPATPTYAYVDPQTHGPSANPTSEEEGYYYYYYPVQQDKKKGGLFDMKHDNDIISLVIVGVLLVGGLLLALSYYQPEDARTLQVSYHDMYNLASKVYQAINKIY